MPAAQIFDTHTACELAQNLLTYFVCDFHALLHKKAPFDGANGAVLIYLKT